MDYLTARASLLGFLFRLRQETVRSHGLEAYLDVAMRCQYRNWAITPNQKRSEIRELLHLLATEPPARLLEIGTSLGGTLCLFCRVAAPDALLLSIDLPAHHSPLRRILLRSFASGRQRIRLLTGDSQQSAMRDRAVAHLGKVKPGFPFIDGDHGYDGARRDFELYRPLVRSGGWIASHDIVPGPPERVGGVPRLWQEVRDAYSSREMVADWQQGGFGIGVLQMP